MLNPFVYNVKLHVLKMDVTQTMDRHKILYHAVVNLFKHIFGVHLNKFVFAKQTQYNQPTLLPMKVT